MHGQSDFSYKSILEYIWGLNSNRLTYLEVKRFVTWFVHLMQKMPIGAKRHTIREKNKLRYNGELISFRCWLGKPYDSKHVVLAPELSIKVIPMWIDKHHPLTFIYAGESKNYVFRVPLAYNDGLSLKDFSEWFNLADPNIAGRKEYQIICWDHTVTYEL